MTSATRNASLNSARYDRDDEFCTRVEGIERELRHYKEHFRGKTVLLNCDDPFESNFFQFFAMNFNHLELKKLISISYAGSPIVGQQLSLFDIAGLDDRALPKEPYEVEITNVPDHNNDGAIDLVDVEELLRHDANTSTMLTGDGDFRSAESIELLHEADVVVTNAGLSSNGSTTQ